MSEMKVALGRKVRVVVSRVRVPGSIILLLSPSQVVLSRSVPDMKGSLEMCEH
jgi:hypothetical protein